MVAHTHEIDGKGHAEEIYECRGKSASDDLEVALLEIVGHKEGGDTHQRRHELTAEGRGGLDRCRCHAREAGSDENRDRGRTRRRRVCGSGAAYRTDSE